MRKTIRPWHFVLATPVLVGLGVVGVQWGPVFLRLLTHVRVAEQRTLRGYTLVGFSEVHRRTGQHDGLRRYWYEESGFLAMEIYNSRGNEFPAIERHTEWGIDGTIWKQADLGRPWVGPPWKWDQGDRREPDAPWLGTGETPDEWWETRQ